MKLGVILPQYEIGLDSGALRAFAQAVEGPGYQYLVAFGSLCTDNPWHEPLVFSAYLAGWTQKLELTTGVIVAPSRQTLLLARQHACGTIPVLQGDLQKQEGLMRSLVYVCCGGEEKWVTTARAWRSLGVTHLSVDTVGASLTSLDAHIDALRRMKEVLDA